MSINVQYLFIMGQNVWVANFLWPYILWGNKKEWRFHQKVTWTICLYLWGCRGKNILYSYASNSSTIYTIWSFYWAISVGLTWLLVSHAQWDLCEPRVSKSIMSSVQSNRLVKGSIMAVWMSESEGSTICRRERTSHRGTWPIFICMHLSQDARCSNSLMLP